MMKDSFFRKLAALLIAAACVFTVIACGGEEESSDTGAGTKPGAAEKDLSWLNSDGTLPIVKEGTEKTLRIAVQMYNDSGAPEDQWFYKFVEKEMNIHLEITKFTASNTNEYMSLLLADGDLPDIIIGGGFGTSALVSHGEEGLFADLAPYITPELTPNLYKLYNEKPEYRDIVSDSEGRIWSLGFVTDPSNRGALSRAFINYDWLDEAGLTVPATLDEFIDMLREFKKRGDDIIPMGGSYVSNNPGLIILNALGYITEDATGLGIALRNGEPVLPVADREAYGEFLKVMNTLYTEGLISPDFYTMDASAASALLSSGRVGYMTTAPFVVTANFGSWWGAMPLTSDYNQTRQWPSGMSVMKPGSVVFSAESENLELALAFIDWFYEETALNYNLSENGPSVNQTEYIYDDKVTGFDINKETFQPFWPDYENNKGSYSSKNDFLGKEVYLWGYRIVGRGTGTLGENKDALQYGYKPEEIYDPYPDVSAEGVQGELRKQTANDGEMNFRAAMEDTMVPYVAKEMPLTIYYDEATAEKVDALVVLVREYAIQETAKFVTGRRSLDEIDAYFDEIEKLGAVQILDFTRQYYANHK